MDYQPPSGALIVGSETRVPLRNGQYVKAINFDNAATTPPFQAVLQEIADVAPWYGPIHRSAGYQSRWVSRYYEDARNVVADFVGADLAQDTVIFVKNTTEAINKVASLLASRNQGLTVLSTAMEHHSNDLPWRGLFSVDYVQTDDTGRLSLTDLELKLKKHGDTLCLVTVTGASNVTGYKNPIHQIARLAHEYGAEILVDGAQLVPHGQVNMQPHGSLQHLDYLVFSAHKMYAPFGTGVLIGCKKSLAPCSPHMPGGGTVHVVTPKQVLWKELPQREESGTPNFMGVAALVAAIRCLNEMSLAKLEEHERNLISYILPRLRAIPDVVLYVDDLDLNNRVSIIPFNLNTIPHHRLASILAMEFGIAVRNGCFCAQPYIQKLLGITEEAMHEHMTNLDLPMPGMLRISFGCYNTYAEIDYFIESLRHISQYASEYLQIYGQLPEECSTYF